METKIPINKEFAPIKRISTLPIEDYSLIFEKYNIPYKRVSYFLQVGEITENHGWILHISVVRWQVSALLETTLPILINNKMSFRIIQDKFTARNILDGNFGIFQLGKILSIYPNSSDSLVHLTRQLIQLTKIFKGPEILTDAFLGGCLYARYGYRNRVIEGDDTGAAIYAVPNGAGMLEIDRYTIPFVKPSNVEWPFECSVTQRLPSNAINLPNNYKALKTLKTDIKGDVSKALYVKHFFKISWCVLKQGKSNMWSDESDRDMSDRLKWQLKVHEDLKSDVPIPKILGLLTHNEDTFLALQYIPGKSLFSKINELNKGGSYWKGISNKNKIKLLNYILKIIDIISALHHKGYIHRDITPANFQITRNGKIFILDNELSYSIIENLPYPPFEGGTFGFMSQEQANKEMPKHADDIYALGSLLIYTMTGLSPLALSGLKYDTLKRSLHYFIGEQTFSSVISYCHDINPGLRPLLTQIKEEIISLKLILNKAQKQSVPSKCEINKEELVNIISKAIDGLVTEPTVINNNLWQSKAPSKINMVSANLKFKTMPGVCEGISGILYSLGKFKKLNLDISKCVDNLNSGIRYLVNDHLSDFENIPAGLYAGSYGVALSIATAIDSGLVCRSANYVEAITKCIDIPVADLELATGLTGRGMAVMLCSNFLEKDFVESRLNFVITELTAYKAKNSFYSVLQDSSRKRNIRFSDGELGILWFLLTYCSFSDDKSMKHSILESLTEINKIAWQLKKLIDKKGIKYFMNYDDIIWKTLQGIIVVNIKAYDLFKIKTSKKLVEEILDEFPPFITSDNFTQSSGMAGLGEIYLEAFNAFQNGQWKNRAELIANCFIHTFHSNEQNGTGYWRGNNFLHPTADLMFGNSGIIYFLTRILQPDKLNFLFFR